MRQGAQQSVVSIGGILPVSGLAVGAYMAMLIAGFFIGPATEASVRRLAWAAMLVIVGSVAGSAIWFIILQKWVIGAFCPYCMTAHITGLILAGLIIWQAPKQLSGDSANPDILRRLPAISLTIVGLALSGIMAVTQVIITPPPVYISGESKDNMSSIDPNNVPLVGSPNAPYIVKLLFDYECPHCQELHFMLNAAIRQYDGKLAFMLCPAPLNKQCNPYILGEMEEYKDSCELAKIGLAVWVANREAFPAFDNWMFSFESGDRWQPRSIEAAKAKAIELAGQAKFDAAQADPWINQYFSACVQIYGQNLQKGKGGVPKLVYGSHWVIPEVYNADDLIMILQNSLGVPTP